MRVEIRSPSYFTIQGNEVRDWRESLRRRVDGYQFTRKYKNGFWDGYWRPGSAPRFIHGETYRMNLGRGLLPRFRLEFPSAEIKNTSPQAAVLNFGGFDLGDLRDYQTESLVLIGADHWGRIALATNAGKGAIIAFATSAAVEAGVRVIILCNEVSVFQALKEQALQWTPDLDLGFVEAGRTDVPQEPAVLAMVPTLARRVDKEPWEKWLKGIGMALLDEGDRATAETWKKILRKMPNNHFRIGFSGTFMQKDDHPALLQEEMMGPILIRIKNKELVERSISARPYVELYPYTAPIPYLPRHRWKALNGPERRLFIYDRMVIDNQERHSLIQFLLHDSAPNAVVVNRIVHGEILAEILPDAVYLQGSDSKEYRLEQLERFRRGDFQNLIVTKILDRGTNLLGHTIGLIFASGEGSDVQTLQRIGRGLRRTGSKEFLFLKDVADRGHKYLSKASKKRLAVYNEEDFQVDVILPREVGWGSGRNQPEGRQAANA